MAIRLSLHPMETPIGQVFIPTAHTKPPVSPNRQTVRPLGGVYGN